MPWKQPIEVVTRPVKHKQKELQPTFRRAHRSFPLFARSGKDRTGAVLDPVNRVSLAWLREVVVSKIAGANFIPF
jgi:hypothetical protein